MSLDPAEQLVICVNGSEEMKRDEAAVGGQLWMQGDRRMTAHNLVLEGMANAKEAAILSATAEAVTWKHALDQEEGPRKGQRVVIYPKDVSQLEQVLSTGDPSIDSEDGHHIAYSQILQAAQSYEKRPIFLREDSEQITSDPIMAEKVPKWMSIAAQVATGNRRRVQEDGPDVMNSDEEDALKEEHGDEIADGCTSDMDPRKGPVKLTRAQVAAQKVAAHALKVPPRSQSPVCGSSDDDDPNGPKHIWSQTKGCLRRNKHFSKPAATVTQKMETRPPPAISAPGLKAAASQKAPAEPKPVPEAKGSKPVPEPKGSKPTTTQKTASRAGGLRSMGGSGQTGTCVARGNPSKT
jgi:hypothetical protein